MKLNIKKFQDGGAMAPEEQAGAPMPEGAPAPEQAPAPAQGGPEQQVQQMAMQIAQQIGDPQIIMMLAEALMQIAQGAAQQAQPAYQMRGGKMYRIR